MEKQRQMIIVKMIFALMLVIIFLLVVPLLLNEFFFLTKDMDEIFITVFSVLCSIVVASLAFIPILRKENLERISEKKCIQTSNEEIQEENRANNSSVTSDIKRNYIDDYIVESRAIADRIFSTSMISLSVGLLIAVFGILIFSFNFSVSRGDGTQELGQRLLDYLPRFGTLFFIEFIAFFFLKQYRVLIEEYRYYEALKRDRQHKKFILDIIEKYKDEPETLKVVIDYMSTHNVKVPEITGDHKIQSEKAVYDDMNILTKVTEILKVVNQK